MAATYGTQNSTHKRSTVYESCKKIIEARNRFQKLQSQINSSDFELKKPMSQSCKSQNVNPNVFQIYQQYVESQQEEMDDNKVELILSDIEKMTNKSELYTENMNSFMERLSTMNQVLLTKKTDSKFNKDNIEINSWLKSEKWKIKLNVCSKCDAQFENITELTLHFKQNHMKKRGRPAIPVECYVCQKKFSCKKDYAIHSRIHSAKTYVCLYCKKLCFLNVFHSCKKNMKFGKPKHHVWDACKKVLNEKSFQQVPSENSTFFVPKLPISKKVVFMNMSPNEVAFKNLKTSSDKMITNFISHLKENKIINSSVNSISCDQDSVEQLLSECKNLDNLQSNNLVNFETEAIHVAEIDNTDFFCNICDISFQEIEKYEAHSTHLHDEFCQIREGDEELHVCNVCGGCFTELNAFQAHKFTHANEEWSDINN